MGQGIEREYGNYKRIDIQGKSATGLRSKVWKGSGTGKRKRTGTGSGMRIGSGTGTGTGPGTGKGMRMSDWNWRRKENFECNVEVA